ncbi:MAG: DUF1566 domain-containing protein [bacterium]
MEQNVFRRRILPVLTALFLVFGLTALSHAVLIVSEPVPGEFVVLDEDTNLMWVQDANLAMTLGDDADGIMNWATAMGWADGLSYAGYDDWRLPSALNSDGSGPCNGYGCSDSEMGHLFYVEGVTSSSPSPFTNVQSPYVLSTELNSYFVWHFYMYGLQNTYYTDSNVYYAWAVRSADVAAVPEPGTLFLLGTGLSGLALFRKRAKRLHG